MRMMKIGIRKILDNVILFGKFKKLTLLTVISIHERLPVHKEWLYTLTMNHWGSLVVIIFSFLLELQQ
ncbi:hypothetical protein HFA01_23400 [Halobacillus faecis]|uniref:Uncharacterized protein n=1 Tax=Halobacillus faecis TaxID=360184 RepID=A0A511WUX3_9BACI|nr:hypothetical protein HFA01_23400 [Halobacillus faecis]